MSDQGAAGASALARPGRHRRAGDDTAAPAGGRRITARALPVCIAVLIAVLSAGSARLGAASSPSTTSTSTSTTIGPTPTTSPLGDGVFTDPSGSFSVRFSNAPSVTTDDAGTATSYLVNVGEDSETVSVVAPTAFGATGTSPAAERAERFLAASGDEVELLANTQTRLGPFPAAYFIARIVLVDDKPAVLYGVVAVREKDVTYAVHTDVGGDDAAAARAFVESFTVHIDPPPRPTTTATAPTTSAVAATSASARTTTVAPTTASPTSTIPDGTTISFDGRWWVTFPADAGVTFRASAEGGMAYSEYGAVVGDDTLAVRVIELPAGYEATPAAAVEAVASARGGRVEQSADVTVGALPAVRATLATGDSGAAGATVDVLAVVAGRQLITVIYEDGGEPSREESASFLDSFHLA